MIRLLDVFAMLANVNMICAHLLGIITSLYLLHWADN
ncbi:DUF3611 family protein [Nostocaceae cyanobacterium CENA357]|uniref:DUF3611 family protein n=1 Tax=Atlanticothrix silvestris CENA357 TaxID=1725252 RepID=A0A8J7HMV9_9CYAN|nr:DUF3611 family protein [Atlanticothrix silvestris]MBH8556099.1 DUF3611 family protein [Atlanticothrix silvestris CENA357]